MLVNDRWIWVPAGKIEYRTIEGDSADTAGGHWCGEPYDGGYITYCAFLPPTMANRRARRQVGDVYLFTVHAAVYPPLTVEMGGGREVDRT